MTEYEIADLAVSTQEVFFQQWELAQGMGDRAFDLIQQFGNLLFGYLIVAYFVGAQLTRVQSAILTVLYLAWQVRLFFVLYGLQINGSILVEGMREISPDVNLAIPSILAVLALLSCLTLASLYFMWSIRHPKTE
jgi:hypothetical protein